MFRMKHIPTGLYYCPSREVQAPDPTGVCEGRRRPEVKSNLSKIGKIYGRRPTLKYIGTPGFSSHIGSVIKNNGGWITAEPSHHVFVESDWIIEEVKSV